MIKSVLRDPDNCVDAETFQKLSRKVDRALFEMSKTPSNGGNPFLFSFTGNKTHQLCYHIPGFHQKSFNTAATDGKQFFWNPEFLASLHPKDVVTVMCHEATHVVLKHVERSVGKHPRVWNIAIDYVVNAILEHDHRARGFLGSPWKSSVFGPRISLQDFLNHLDGKTTLPNQGYGVFTDPSLYQEKVNDIYDKILAKWPEEPPRGGEDEKDDPQGKDGSKLDGQSPSQEGGSDLGPLDTHLPSKVEDEKLTEEIVQASLSAEAMEPGSTPAYIQAIVKKLTNPSFDFTQLVRFSLFNRERKDGPYNDWKRPRRRGLSLGQFLPRRHTHKPRWLCLLDTSGSMAEEDLRFGVSQLKSFGTETDGIIVPCDAKVHWDQAKKIDQADDLESTAVVGRGGTLFTEFFQEFPSRLGVEFDVIIVITDGKCGQVPWMLKPSSPVIWAITSSVSYQPSFGTAVPLRV